MSRFVHVAAFVAILAHAGQAQSQEADVPRASPTEGVGEQAIGPTGQDLPNPIAAPGVDGEASRTILAQNADNAVSRSRRKTRSRTNSADGEGVLTPDVQDSAPPGPGLEDEAAPAVELDGSSSLALADQSDEPSPSVDEGSGRQFTRDRSLDLRIERRAAQILAQDTQGADEPNLGPTGEDLSDFVLSIDPNAQIGGNVLEFDFSGRRLVMIFDESAGRMRLMTPIVSASSVTPALAARMLQANFDSVLDVRYAIANDLVWSVFLHPLPTLAEEDLTSAVVQVAIAAETFGTGFTSGEFTFGGGDSGALQQELLDELEDARNRRDDSL